MRTLVLSICVVFSGALFASIPEVVITFMDSYNGHAPVAGKLTARPEAPLGVTVRNGDIAYATVTDVEGRWGIVIRHRSVNLLLFRIVSPIPPI